MSYAFISLFNSVIRKLKILNNKNLLTGAHKISEIVITGSTSGIGEQYAIQLAEKGMNICLISRDPIKLERTAKKIETSSKVEVKCIRADFTSTAVYSHIKDELRTLPEIGILVNNVGTANPIWQPFHNENPDFNLQVLNVNVASVVMMTSMIVPGMIERRKGLIINIGSMASIVPLIYASNYSSTKHFLANFSVCLECELDKYNIDVQCVTPGFIDTQILSEMNGVKSFSSKFPKLLLKPDEYVKSALATLNISPPLLTAGYWTHAFALFLFTTLFPTKFLQTRAVRFMALKGWDVRA